MGQDERVNIIDFIINVLKEHEKNLDAQLARLEDIINSDRSAPSPRGEAKARSLIRVVPNKWSEFRERSMEPRMLAFNVSDDRLEVSALKEDVLYVYRENIPELSMEVEKEGDKLVIRGSGFRDLFDNLSLMAGVLQCGLSVKHRKVDLKLPDENIVQKIIFEVDVEMAKSWLSKQLVIEEKSIIFGSIET